MHFNAAVRSARVRMDCEHRVGRKALRYALATANQSDLDLSTHRNLRAVRLLLGHPKIESSVRYFGVEAMMPKHKFC